MLVEYEKLEGTSGLKAIADYVSYQLNQAKSKKGQLNGTNGVK